MCRDALDNRNWVLSLAYALLLTTTLSLRAQQLPVPVYTTADGLAHDRVRNIIIDSRGFLWFCTLQGLNRFDGQRFIEYSIRDGLGSASVLDVLETREGDYWVATEAGVSRLARAHVNQDGAAHRPLDSAQLFTTYSVGPGAQNVVNIAYQDRAGHVLVGTDDGVFQIEEARNGLVTFRNVDLGLQRSENRIVRVRAFLEDGDGSLWIGTSQGLVRRLPGGQMVEHQLKPAGRPDDVRALLQDKDGRLWVGHNGGLIAFIPERHALPASRRHMPSRIVSHEPISGTVHVVLPGTPGPVYRYDTVLGGKGVRDVHASPDGDLWFAQNNGLGHFDGERFHVYSTDHGITGDAFNSITADATGSLWLGSDTNGAAKVIRTQQSRGHRSRTRDSVSAGMA